MNANEFREKVGHEPMMDDLERVNCEKAGEIGHWYCGWCDSCDMPRFQCGCRASNNKAAS